MTFSLSPQLEKLFSGPIVGRELSELSKDIIRLSDFYINRQGARTPWTEAHVLRAYCAYFLPLNVARLKSVFKEVRRFIKPELISEVWDFGSGIGATHWSLEEEEWLPPKELICVEIDREAIRLHQQLAQKFPARWSPEWNRQARPKPGALGVFSFSFIEMHSHLPNLNEFSHLLFIEPSFRDTGRTLMEWRQRLIDAGYAALAPCTHSQTCPLLKHSSRDWCHARIHFQGSKTWSQLEALLPMKNKTLTFSYLLMSRDAKGPDWRGAIRVIGDTLYEKGKVRQMICRGTEREFFSWLKRDGEPPAIPNGALIRDPGHCEVKGNEVRPYGILRWE